jgi:hydroxymethylbilane synthase
MRRLRIGTRGSPLGLWQAAWIGSALQSRMAGLEVDYIKIKTLGDRILDVPLAKVGGKGLFVKEIEEALLSNRVDLAVHSVKDIPTELPSRLQITAVARREDPRDVLVSKEKKTLEMLPAGGRVGTSSLRRRAQILWLRPDLEVVGLRGNLDTRLRKLEKEGLDAVVLAAAGLKRLGQAERVTEYFPPEIFVPAIGQGALAAETREDDQAINELVQEIDNLETRLCVEAERAFLARLQGGCQVPIGAHAWLTGRVLTIRGMIAGVDGRPMYREEISGEVFSGQTIGKQLAESLLDRGGRTVLETLYSRTGSL